MSSTHDTNGQYIALPAEPDQTGPVRRSSRGDSTGADSEIHSSDGEHGALTHGSISFWDGVAVGCGDIIGSGIFASPGVVLSLTGSVGMSLVVWFLGGLLSIVGLICIIELSVATPSAGGLFTYLQMAFGDQIAFSWQYINFVTIVPGTLAALALTFAAYLSGFLPGGDGTMEKPNMQVKLVAAGAIALVTCINCSAPGIGTSLARMFTTITLCGCTFVFVIGVIQVARGGAHAHEFNVNFDPDEMFANIEWAHIGPALITALWAFAGWADIAAMSEEVVDAKRNLPRVGGIALTIITTAYLLMNAAYLAVLDQPTVIHSTDMGVSFAKHIYGPWAGYLVAICVCTSTFGGLVNCMFLSSRQFYATARAGMFPRFIGRLNARGSPWTAVCFTGLLSIVLTLPTSFAAAVNYVGFALWVYYGLIGVALVVIRRKLPNLDRPFKVPLFPYLPLAYAALCLYISINTFIKSPKPCGLSLLFLLSAFPVHYVCFRMLPRYRARNLAKHAAAASTP